MRDGAARRTLLMGFIVGAYRRVPARLGLGPREVPEVLGRERGRHDRAAVVAANIVAAGSVIAWSPKLPLL